MSIKLLTLCLVHQDSKILLGMKKRGFGVGKWNGFGGKVIEGESIEDAAKRETNEECGIILDKIEKLGIVEFEFINNLGEIMQVHIFKATEFSGEVIESEEMNPRWFNIDEIPFDSMWSDDPYWMPLFLSDKKFKGKFLYDNKDQVLEKFIEVVDQI